MHPGKEEPAIVIEPVEDPLPRPAEQPVPAPERDQPVREDAPA